MDGKRTEDAGPSRAMRVPPPPVPPRPLDVVRATHSRAFSDSASPSGSAGGAGGARSLGPVRTRTRTRSRSTSLDLSIGHTTAGGWLRPPRPHIRPRPLHAVGLDAALDDLASLLRGEGAAAITGSAGLGKTTLAEAYARLSRGIESPGPRRSGPRTGSGRGEGKAAEPDEGVFGSGGAAGVAGGAYPGGVYWVNDCTSRLHVMGVLASYVRACFAPPEPSDALGGGAGAGGDADRPARPAVPARGSIDDDELRGVGLKKVSSVRSHVLVGGDAGDEAADADDGAQAVARLHRWMGSADAPRWLLVFDGADDVATIADALPPRDAWAGGDIIVTTRLEAGADSLAKLGFGLRRSLPLKGLSASGGESAAATLLLRRTFAASVGAGAAHITVGDWTHGIAAQAARGGLADRDPDEDSPHGEMATALFELVGPTMLGGLPLALELAGACIGAAFATSSPSVGSAPPMSARGGGGADFGIGDLDLDEAPLPDFRPYRDRLQALLNTAVKPAGGSKARSRSWGTDDGGAGGKDAAGDAPEPGSLAALLAARGAADLTAHMSELGFNSVDDFVAVVRGDADATADVAEMLCDMLGTSAPSSRSTFNTKRGMAAVTRILEQVRADALAQADGKGGSGAAAAAGGAGGVGGGGEGADEAQRAAAVEAAVKLTLERLSPAATDLLQQLCLMAATDVPLGVFSTWGFDEHAEDLDSDVAAAVSSATSADGGRRAGRCGAGEGKASERSASYASVVRSGTADGDGGGSGFDPGALHEALLACAAAGNSAASAARRRRVVVAQCAGQLARYSLVTQRVVKAVVLPEDAAATAASMPRTASSSSLSEGKAGDDSPSAVAASKKAPTDLDCVRVHPLVQAIVRGMMLDPAWRAGRSKASGRGDGATAGAGSGRPPRASAVSEGKASSDGAGAVDTGASRFFECRAQVVRMLRASIPGEADYGYVGHTRSKDGEGLEAAFTVAYDAAYQRGELLLPHVLAMFGRWGVDAGAAGGSRRVPDKLPPGVKDSGRSITVPGGSGGGGGGGGGGAHSELRDALLAGQLWRRAAYHCYAVGRPLQGEPLARASLAVFSSLLGDSRLTADANTTVAHLLRHAGRLTAAQPLYRAAFDMRGRVLGDHADTALALTQLAALRTAQSAWGEAEGLYRRGCDMTRRVFGEHSLGFAMVCHALADVIVRSAASSGEAIAGRLDEAIRLLRNAHTIREDELGADDAVTIATMETLADSLERRSRLVPREAGADDRGEAATLRRRAEALWRRGEE